MRITRNFLAEPSWARYKRTPVIIVESYLKEPSLFLPVYPCIGCVVILCRRRVLIDPGRDWHAGANRDQALHYDKNGTKQPQDTIGCPTSVPAYRLIPLHSRCPG